MASTYVLERRRMLVDLAARSAVLDYVNMEGLEVANFLGNYIQQCVHDWRLDSVLVPCYKKAGYLFWLSVDVVCDTPRDSRLEAGLVEAPK
jgi:hypothetical protein